MKIAFVTKYKNYPGGVESITHEICRTLSDAGHTTEIFSPENDVFPFSPYFGKKLSPHLSSFDRVICNGEWGNGICHPHAISLFHGSCFGYKEAVRPFLGPRSSLKLSVQAYLEKRAARGKCVVAVSLALKAILEKGGIPVDGVIENGVDLSLFQPRTSLRHGFLFVGSSDYIGKGFDILEGIQKRGYPIDAVTATHLGALRTLPQRPQKEMAELYQSYKLLFFPSRFEGLQLVPLEAMASGMPVVMSPVGLGVALAKEIPEFVTESLDPAEFCQKAEHILLHWQKYSERARAYVEEYHSPDRFRQRWLQIIERGYL